MDIGVDKRGWKPLARGLCRWRGEPCPNIASSKILRLCEKHIAEWIKTGKS